MARSAKQLKAVKRRGNAFQDGAMAVGGMISRNPVLVGGSTAFLVTLFYVSANALWYQPFPHVPQCLRGPAGQHRRAFGRRVGRGLPVSTTPSDWSAAYSVQKRAVGNPPSIL